MAWEWKATKRKGIKIDFGITVFVVEEQSFRPYNEKFLIDSLL